MKQIIDELSQALTGLIPEGGQVAADMEKNIKAVLQQALGKLDVVPKEEFEVQRQLLARLSEQVATLEKKLAELEH